MSKQESNQQRTAPADLPDFGMDTSMLDQLDGPKNAGSLVPVQNSTMISVTGEIVTAQKVAYPRNMGEVFRRIGINAAVAGARWFYRIPFKNKSTGQTDYVEGISIKGVNGVFREYGNCLLTTRVQDTATHWIIYARFVDLETGSTYDRPFQQRKGQDTGMKDAERRADMVFQIGVSKATRNVLANALEDLCAHALESAKSGLVARVNKNPAGAKKWIVDHLAELEIDIKRVAKVYGRNVENWTVPDLAKIYAEITSIEDGMVDASEMYPVIEAGGAEPKREEPKSGPQTEQAKPATAGAHVGAPDLDDAGATLVGEAPQAPTDEQKLTYAKVEKMLQDATTAEAFDFARSHIKDMPMDQIKELAALATELYAAKFKATAATKDKKSDKPTPPLFGE